MLSHIIFILISYIVIILIIMSLSGIISFIIPSFGKYRRVLIDMSFVYSAVFSWSLLWSMINTNYFLQQHVFLIGWLLLFLLSPFVVIIRKHPVWVALIWSGLFITWLLVAPIPSEAPWPLRQ